MSLDLEGTLGEENVPALYLACRLAEECQECVACGCDEFRGLSVKSAKWDVDNGLVVEVGDAYSYGGHTNPGTNKVFRLRVVAEELDSITYKEN